MQPDKGFDRLYDKAIDSLYKKLRRVLPNTFYGIHDFIEVSDETLPHPPTSERRRVNSIVDNVVPRLVVSFPRRYWEKKYEPSIWPRSP